MGAAGSSQPQGAAVGQQIAVPQDAVPYPGPQIQYCLVTVNAKLSSQIGSFTSSLMTTNVEQYYHDIARPYEQGFVMQQFQKIPGVQQAAGFTSLSIPYQAILQRPVNVSTHERYQLRVEKSHLQTKQFVNWGTTQTVAANTTEIQQKIQATASQCGRLICIETTGFQQYRGKLMGGVDGISGVDLFFNMPLHPNPIRYVYQAVNCPIVYKMKSSFPAPKYECLTDISGQFSAFLNQGWKLVEINFDSSRHMQQTGFTTAQDTQNAIWFFEKEESRFHDNRPVWQGCVVEYMHTVKGGFGGTYAKGGWDEQLNQMGQRGWELACMLETPELNPSGFTSVSYKILMFFQRRILAAPQPQPTGYPTPEQPPPSYGAATSMPTAPSSGPSQPQGEKGPPPPGFNM